MDNNENVMYVDLKLNAIKVNCTGDAGQTAIF